MAADDFHGSLERAGTIVVDVAHLGDMAQAFRTLSGAVPAVQHSSDEADHTVSPPSGSPLGSLLIHEAAELAARIRSTHTAFVQNLTRFAGDLDRAAEVVTQLAETYTSVEQRNDIRTSEVTRLLDAAPSGNNAGGGQKHG